jgi:hypothetical protein
VLQGSSLSLLGFLSLGASSACEIGASSKQPSGGGTGRGSLLARGIGRIEGEESGEKALSI